MDVQRRVTDNKIEEAKLKELVEAISSQKATEMDERSIAESRRVMFGAALDCTRPNDSMPAIQLTCAKYLPLIYFSTTLHSLLTTNYRASSRSTVRAINSTPLSSTGCPLRRDFAYIIWGG